MVSRLLSILLALFVVVGGCGNIKPMFKSVQVLSDIHAKGSLHHDVVLTEDFNHEMCTAFAVRVGDWTRWITAAHCIVRDEEGQVIDSTVYKIGGKDAHLLKWSGEADLALFSGSLATPITIGLGEAEIGEEVYSIGFFWKDKLGILTKGITSQPDSKGKRIFNLAGGPGSSGAPIFTKDNIVISLLQQGPCSSPCPVASGASVKELRAFLYDEQ